jgi:hypothetical protein
VGPDKSYLWDWISSKGKSGGVLYGFLDRICPRGVYTSA